MKPFKMNNRQEPRTTGSGLQRGDGFGGSGENKFCLYADDVLVTIKSPESGI